MKTTLGLLLLLFVALGCSKRDSNNNNSLDTNKTIGSETSPVYPLPITNAKKYQKGESIELYDLIYMLLPDENTDGKYMDWRYLEIFKPLFTVSNGVYDVKFSKGFERNAEFGDPNQPLIVPTKKRYNTEAILLLRFIGSETGYNRFEIWAASCINFKDYNLHSLFSKKEFTKKILGTCDEETIKQSELYCDYEIKIPGKKSFGLAISGSQCGGRNYFGDDMHIKCFLDVNETQRY